MCPCNKYATKTFSNTIQSLVSLVVERVKAQGSGNGISMNNETLKTNNGVEPILGLLHVRRGDTKSDCDTSLETMRSYFECSFDVSTPVQRPIILALASDETDMEYRRNITEMIGGLTLPGDDTIRGVDLDAIVWRTIADEVNEERLPRSNLNNYHVYLVAYQLRKQPKEHGIDFVLQRRRNIECNQCDLNRVTNIYKA